jgi:hypothetical protein
MIFYCAPETMDSENTADAESENHRPKINGSRREGEKHPQKISFDRRNHRRKTTRSYQGTDKNCTKHTTRRQDCDDNRKYEFIMCSVVWYSKN